MRRHRTPPLLLCSLIASVCLSVIASPLEIIAPLTTKSGSIEPQARVQFNRFGRALKQVSYLEGAVEQYLIPTMAAQICEGADCCQEDDYASPYQIMMLNSSQAVYGDRTYTTFFMYLMNRACDADVDFAGCCNANVNTIWIDVDPTLKVNFATLNGTSTVVHVQQDSYGFRIDVNSTQFQSVSVVNPSLISVTVEGAVSQLCPLPSLAPISGLCDVIVEGGTSANANACCPKGVSTPFGLSSPFIPPVPFFQCIAEEATSPFAMSQAQVSGVYTTANGGQVVDYHISLLQRPGCTESGANSCCGMQLQYLQLKVLSSAVVTAVSINGLPMVFSLAPWNQDSSANAFQGLLLQGLNWGVEDVPTGGFNISISVQVPNTAVVIPQLCSTPPADSPQGSYGACSFFLHSEDGHCCPSGETNAVIAVPAGTCNPPHMVAIADTSMTFAYYENIQSVATNVTDFSFLLTNSNGAGCSKAYCNDTCGWSLAVNEAVVSTLGFAADAGSSNGGVEMELGARAVVTFAYTAGSQSITYTISSPGSVSLESLCRANSHPDQGSFPCAATVKSASVYAMVFFSQDSLVLINYPPPSIPVPAPTVCASFQPMADSCVRVDSSTFNYPEQTSTVFDFFVKYNDPAVATCTADAIVSFEVLLTVPVFTQLASSRSLVPLASASFDQNQGIYWSSTPPSVNSATHYTFSAVGVKTVAEICLQGMPNQPANTCLVQFQGPDSCYVGYITPTRDLSLIFTPDLSSAPDSSSSSRAGVIAPAVIVPIVVLALIALVLLAIRRRRQAFSAQASSPSSNNLNEPLAAAEGDDAVDASGASVAASDVQIRLPSRSAGGARQ